MDSFAGLSLDERKMVVGIDFGTTFSGLSWAETRRSDNQSVIETWPSNLGTHEGASSAKVPTEVRYTPEGEVEWGLQIPPGVVRYKWFKLGLAEGKISTVDGKKRSAEELATAYLKGLIEHLMYTLEQKIGKAILETTPIEFCLTVPAIWSEVAKAKTLKACEKAGLKSEKEILLVSEPEAAAIYALHGLDRHGLQIGDTFVLCDAGGGTVDLISYTITDLYPMLKVKESAAGTGGVCGSTFLNRRFGEFFKSKLGKQPGWDAEILAEAMEKFDSVTKKHYSPATSNRDGYLFAVPGMANDDKLGIKRGRLTITPSEMLAIFEPVVEKVITLVKGQIFATKKKISSVLLVGGFGQNNYLKERLRESLGRSIIVLQPPNAWTAVVRGAVMMGLARANSKLASVGLVSRAARKHYGIKLRTVYDPELGHQRSERFWSDKHKVFKVNAMRWFIEKGLPVKEGQPVLLNFNNEFLVSKGKPKKADTEILCDEESPSAPVHENDNVRKLVLLEGDLSNLSQADLDKTITTRNDGLRYYAIQGTIEATFSSASTKYVLLIQGKRYDTVTAEYA